MLFINPDLCMDQIRGMMVLEDNYLCEDYLDYVSNIPGGERVAAELDSHRSTISTWMFAVLDEYEISREVVYHSMKTLDRYLLHIISRFEYLRVHINNLISGSEYELAALAALQLAVKSQLSNQDKRRLAQCQCPLLELEGYVMLGRGKFSVQDVKEMEKRMLSTLKWRMSPPNPAEFDNRFLMMLHNHFSMFHGRTMTYQATKSVIEKISEISAFLNQLAVIDYYFVTDNASTIAFSAILVAMRELRNYVPGEVYHVFLTELQSAGLDQDSEDVTRCRKRLEELFRMNWPDEDMEAQAHFSGYSVASPNSVAQF